MSPLKHSKSFAARMGRWSANHWKTAVVGWLAVRRRCPLFVGMEVGTKTISQNDANVGESRTADRIISEAGFTVDKKGETHRGADRDGAHPVEDADRDRSGLPGRDRRLRSRPSARSRR